MFWIILEALIALALGLFIVWWTMRGHPTAPARALPGKPEVDPVRALPPGEGQEPPPPRPPGP